MNAGRIGGPAGPRRARRKISQPNERVLRGGLFASHQTEVGTALPICRGYKTSFAQFPRPVLKAAEVEAAIERAETAIENVKRSLEAEAADGTDLFAAMMVEMLNDSDQNTGLVPWIISYMKENQVCLVEAAEAYLSFFASNSNQIMEQVVAQVESLLINILNEKEESLAEIKHKLASIRGPVILVCPNLPDEMLGLLKLPQVVGLVREKGGRRDHISIQARKQGCVSAVGFGGVTAEVSQGQAIIVDGARSKIIVDPLEETIAETKQKIAQCRATLAAISIDSQGPTVTLDGHVVRLGLNIEAQTGISDDFAAGGYDYVGLVRTENVLAFDRYDRLRTQSPSWQTQSAIYERIVRSIADGVSFYFRLVDLDADKALPYLDLSVQYRQQVKESGIAAFLNPENFVPHYLLREQLEALLCARGVENILLPNTFSVANLIALKRISNDIIAKHPRFCRAGRFRAKKFGLMVEDPRMIDSLEGLASGAVKGANLFRYFRFLSLGTNDLTARITGAKRTNGSKKKFEELDPRVLSAIDRTVAVAQKLDLDLSLCGDMANDLLALPVLLGLGLRAVSLYPDMVAFGRHLVRSVSIEECQRLAQGLQSVTTVEQVKKTARQFITQRIDSGSWSGLKPIESLVV